MEIPGYLENWLKMSLSIEIPTRKGEASKNSKGQECLVLKKRAGWGGGREGKAKEEESRNNRPKIQSWENVGTNKQIT